MGQPAVTSGTDLIRNVASFRCFIALLLCGVTGVACTSSDLGTGSVSTTPTDPVDVGVQSQLIKPSGTGLDIEVTRVSDGDSLRATSAEGDLEIRLLGINAPERDDCFGDEAASALESLLTEGNVTLFPWPGETDQFGRQLGLLVAGDTFVNLSLIETGHVLARAQSDHGFDREFEEAERSASESGTGLWAADACGDPVDANLVIVEVEDDPPGDDRQNPNGEWVLIENRGDEVVMEGWVLRDESTRHRYNFPDLTIAAGDTVQVHTGCGNDVTNGPSMVLFWCDPEPPVWNNSGDTAFLLDPNGAIADSYNTNG